MVKFTNKIAISTYNNEIIWKKFFIRVGENTIFYKGWIRVAIDHMKDIYDHENQIYYFFHELQEIFNVQATKFLRFMSHINRIPKDWKYKLKQGNQDVPM